MTEEHDKGQMRAPWGTWEGNLSEMFGCARCGRDMRDDYDGFTGVPWRVDASRVPFMPRFICPGCLTPDDARLAVLERTE